MNTNKIPEKFKLFQFGKGEGIGGFITNETPPEVLKRLAAIEEDPIPKVQLNQLLLLALEGGVSDGFFNYYWNSNPNHCYNLRSLPHFNPDWFKNSESSPPVIKSLDHLFWGLYRLYIDGLLYFGDVRTAFRKLRQMEESELHEFFGSRGYDSQQMRERGPSLPLLPIPKDDRYLISEMACKSYGETPETESELKSALVEAYEEHKAQNGGRVTIRELLGRSVKHERFADSQQQLMLSADDILDQQVESLQDIEKKYAEVAKKFMKARVDALKNTELYLSMVNDLDVYVATSMRNRQDFRKMADDCDKIFSHPKLKGMHLRYFDPTTSAALGHEDKGLIECLMVKCTKALIYFAGERESWGKDAEAAMALSLGKPVIFYCNQKQKEKFFRDVHPLSRLIDFKTGVSIGAIVTSSLEEVSEIIRRIFENQLEYILTQHETRPGFLKLHEKLTGSVVRLQTNDALLAQTFWNHYQNTR